MPDTIIPYAQILCQQGVKMRNRLSEVRKEKGLSQLRLSFLTGIPPSEISRIENGWIRPYAGWRRRLATALGTSERDLFPEENQ